MNFVADPSWSVMERIAKLEVMCFGEVSAGMPTKQRILDLEEHAPAGPMPYQ
jgi:hypothetical protein